jgi:hypothetical protein
VRPFFFVEFSQAGKQLEVQTKSLAVQTASLMEGLEVQKQQTALLRETLEQQKKQNEQFEQTARKLNDVMLSQEASIKGHTEKKVEELRGRIAEAFVTQAKWLIIISGILVIVMIVLVAGARYLSGKP